MYKLKYYSLTKEEKKKLKIEFYQTNFGNSVNKRLNRLLFTGIIALIFGIYLLVDNSTIWDIVIGIITLIASLIFIFGSYKVRTQKLNNYLVKKKK